MLKPTDAGGIYILEIVPTKAFSISHKKIGNHKLSIGYYYYVGSAQTNLYQRIDRHLRKTKKLHWHIDYLTVKKEINIANVYIIKNHSKKFECKLVSDLSNYFNMQFPIQDFGNSDCNLCESHLLYKDEKITYNQLLSLYQSAVIFIPSSKDTFCE